MRVQTPHEIALTIVSREGRPGASFVDDPDDSGGPTNWGITLRTLRRFRLDLDGDGDVDIDDLMRVDPSIAADLFLEGFYRAPGLHRLAARYPLQGQRLRSCVFDWSVHSGPQRPVRAIQRLVCAAADGKVGDRTVAAVDAYLARIGGNAATNEYAAIRRDFYYALADRRPKDRKYVRRIGPGGKGGWIRRAEHFLPRALHLTPAQHLRRVADWA